MEQSQQGSQSSITLSTSAKGVVQPDVKVYASPAGLAALTQVELRDEAIELARIATVVLCKAVDALATAGVPTVFSPEAVASMRHHYAVAVKQVKTDGQPASAA